MELDIKAVLNEEVKTKLKETKEYFFHGGKPNGQSIVYHIGRTRVMIQQGVVHSEVPLTGPISGEIKQDIIEFIGEGMIDTEIFGPRLMGKYILPDDEKTICLVNVDRYISSKLRLTLTGPDRDKMVELYGLIRDGKIMPREEFGGVQGGMSREQLEQEVRLLEMEIDQTKVALQKAQEMVDDKSDQIESLRRRVAEAERVMSDLVLAKGRVASAYRLAAALEEEVLRFSTKKRLATRLTNALNGVEEK